MEEHQSNPATISSPHPVSFSVFCSAIAGALCGFFPFGPLEENWLWGTFALTFLLFFLPPINSYDQNKWIIVQIAVIFFQKKNTPVIIKLKKAIIKIIQLFVCGFCFWIFVFVVPWIIGEWKGGIINSLIGGVIGAVEGRVYHSIFYRIRPLP